LQAKQAEVESNRSELESLRNRTKELEFQLREAHERAAAFEDSPRAGRSYMGGLASRNVSPSPARGTSSPIEVQRLLADAEAKAEAKISDLRNKVHALEMERNEAEEEWAAKLSERVRELEKLRRVITEKEGEYAESLRSRQEKERVIEEAEAAKRAVEKEMKALRAEVEEAKANVTVAAEAEVCDCLSVCMGRLAHDESARQRTSWRGCRCKYRRCLVSWTRPRRTRRR
jgi:septal ring factor EnvC (AmiA/AmiB activator)